MANGCLLLGSVFLFQYFIEPVSLFMSSSLAGTSDPYTDPSSVLFTSLAQEDSSGRDGSGSSSDALASSLTSMSVWSFYHLLWVLPIWGLCYAVSLGCYQSIVDDVHRLQQQEEDGRGSSSSKGSSVHPPRADVKRTLSGTVYAALVWLLMCLQMRVFQLLLPALLRHASSLLLAATQALPLPPSLVPLASLLVVRPLLIASQLCRAFGLIFTAVVYGWYGFDLSWAAAGKEPDERYRLVELHWVYFLGFGLPYVLLLESTSFFVGYGLYLMVFPFTLMLGAVSDFTQQHHHQLRPFHIFQPAQKLALWVIKALDKHLRPSARHASTKMLNKKKK